MRAARLYPDPTRSLLACALIAVVVLGCNSNEVSPSVTPGLSPAPSPTVTQVPVISPTARPTVRLTASPTVPASITPGGVRLAAMPVREISIPACVTGNPGQQPRLGTAPGPTPTPVLSREDRDRVVARADVDRFMASAGPLLEHLVFWSARFEEQWLLAESPEQQAAALHILGGRLAPLCPAAASGDTPPEANGVSSLLGEALRVRHQWSVIVSGDLTCCGMARTSGNEAGRRDTVAVVGEASAAVASLAAEFDLSPDTRDRQSNLVTNSVLGIEIALPAGWLATGDGLSVVLLAPVDLQGAGLAGMGPEGWGAGTAVRVRRLRNPSELTSEEANETFTALIYRNGDVISTGPTMVSGFSAIKNRIRNLPARWAGEVTVVVAGNFTYFFEVGCPSGLPEACDRASEVAAAVIITTSG